LHNASNQLNFVDADGEPLGRTVGVTVEPRESLAAMP
jgi:hypothetical protein